MRKPEFFLTIFVNPRSKELELVSAYADIESARGLKGIFDRDQRSRSREFDLANPNGALIVVFKADEDNLFRLLGSVENDLSEEELDRIVHYLEGGKVL